MSNQDADNNDETEWEWAEEEKVKDEDEEGSWVFVFEYFPLNVRVLKAFVPFSFPSPYRKCIMCVPK